MTEEIASQEIDFMEYGDTQINTIDMERGQRKDLIGEMPVGIAVVRGGNELYIEMVNREIRRLWSICTGTIPVCSRMPSKCAGN